MNIKDKLLDFFFPPRCPFCGKLTRGRTFCPTCLKELPWIQGSETVRKLSKDVRCAAPLWYEGKVRSGILRYKFYGIAAAADALGEVVARCAAEEFSGEFDTVTWVPVGPKRLKQRGYDQTRLLAEAAARLWEVQAVQLLRKPIDNPAQSGLKDAAARRANVLGVYEALPGAEGKHILLVDDIVTSGATLLECARTLQEAGAASVRCVAVAAVRQKKGDETRQNRAE